jgi:hypothetical protein
VAGLLVSWVTRPQPGDAAALDAAMRGSSSSTATPGNRASATPSGTSPTTAAPSPQAAAPTPGARAAAVPEATVTATPAEPGRPAPPPPTPTRLTIDAVGVQMPVVPVGVAANGEMALPRSPAQAGWYRFGAHPGDPQGATVIAGHLDQPWYGTGPLGRLADVAPGDTVVVDSGTTSRRFVVTEVQAVRKTRLDLAALFRTDGPPSLHIVTCGGRFDPVQRHYDENVVVVARPA